MNYQIRGLSIHVEVHGTAEPALVFLRYGGGRTGARLSGQQACFYPQLVCSLIRTDL
jgi:hypothetical protein